jgi:hypothetical protein
MRSAHRTALTPHLTRPQSARRVVRYVRHVATRRRTRRSRVFHGLGASHWVWRVVCILRTPSDVLSLVPRAARRQPRIGCAAHASVASQLAGLPAAHPQTPSPNALHEASCWLFCLCACMPGSIQACLALDRARQVFRGRAHPTLCSVTELGRPDHSSNPGPCIYSGCPFASTM